MSAKRRRSISINEVFVTQLKARAVNLDGSSPTGLALQILLGKAAPIVGHFHHQNKRQISMRESYWLALSVRGNKLQKSAPKVAELILEGKLEPLTNEEVAEGERLALERESKRDSSPRKRRPRTENKTESKAEPEPTEPQEAKAAPDEEDEFEKQARLKRQAALPKGTPIDKSKSRQNSAMKDIRIENDYLGGVYSF